MHRSPVADRGSSVASRLGVAVLIALLTTTMSSHDVFAQRQPPQMRPAVSGLEAAVTSDHPLASAVGADVLRRGGNAIDAAIAMAGVLAVVRPHMNGVGGDSFLLYYEARTRKVHALNGSGRAGSKATPQYFAERGMSSIPRSGILSVSVPGTVAAWSDALGRFGTITLADALAPGIRYAEQGFPVTPRLDDDIGDPRWWSRDPEMKRTYAPTGQFPAPGQLLKAPDLAATLRAIAADGPDAFYKGAIAAKIVGFMEKEGGLLTAADLARHTSTWSEPISTQYRGLTVLAFPPNTQGVTFLEMLNAASHFDLAAMQHNSADYVNTLVSIGKLAYDDRDRFIADPEFAQVPVARLLSAERSKEIADTVRARGAVPVFQSARNMDSRGDTVYVGVIDKDGNAVSYIQSLFATFGSGRMVPGTGIMLHNRGSLYELDATHPNIVAPGKRPFHTLSPAMILNADGTPRMVLGSPGGDGQPQTLMQVLNNMLIFGMTAQVAVEAPRWRAYQTARLAMEESYADAVVAALRGRGHDVEVQEPNMEFGGAQVIAIDPTSKARVSAADFRREAYAIAW